MQSTNGNDDDGGLWYFQNIAPPEPGSLMSELKDMDLDDLASFAEAVKENINEDVEQLKSFIFAHYFIFSKTNQLGDLDTAINHLQGLVDMTKPGDPSYDCLFRDLTVMYARRARETVNQNHVDAQTHADAAICKASELLSVTDYLHPDWYQRWKGLFRIKVIKAVDTGDQSPLDAMMQGRDQAIRDVQWLFDPQICLALGTVPDKKTCIQGLKKAFAATADDQTKIRGLVLNVIADLAHEQWKESQVQADMDEAIDLNEMTTRFGHEITGQNGARVNRVCDYYILKVQQQGRNDETLNRFIRFLELAIIVEANPHSRSDKIKTLRDTLMIRFGALGRPADLERSTRIMKRLLDKTRTTQDDERRRRQHELAADLVKLFEIRGKNTNADFDALNEAIDLGLELASYIKRNPNFPHAPDWLFDVGKNLFLRYRHKKDLSDLDLCIELGEDAIKICHREHARRNTILGVLMTWRYARWECTGNMEDVEKCINETEEDLGSLDDEQTAPTGDSTEPMRMALMLASQGVGLMTKAHWTNDQGLSSEFNKRFDRVLSIASKQLSGSFPGLKAAFLVQSLDSKDFGDPEVQKTVQEIDQILRNTPSNDDDREDSAISALNFSRYLLKRYKHDPERYGADIDKAIAHMQVAIAQIPSLQAHAGMRPTTLDFLSTLFSSKWEHTRNDADSSMATALARDAVSACQPSDPRVADFKLILGQRLMAKQMREPRAADADTTFQEAAALFLEAMNLKEARTVVRVTNGYYAGFCLKILGRLRERADVMEQVVHLLPKISSRALKQRDQQSTLKPLSGLTTSAAASAFDAGKPASHCLELLEFGRGIINSLRLDSRTDLTLLKNKHPTLAKRFIDVRDELDKPTAPVDQQMQFGAGLALNPNLNLRHTLTKEFDDIIYAIRNEPGFDDFMRAPRAEDLKMVSRSAKEAIVVINVTFDRCDAILVKDGKIWQLGLPDLKQLEADKNVDDMKQIRRGFTNTSARRKLTRILVWLWKSVVSPILDELGFTTNPSNGDWPHVWWVPTGALTQLPLHAAGSSNRMESAMDRVVSSYGSTVKALLYTRRNQSQRGPVNASNKIILASMLETPDAAKLTYAVEEVDGLEKLLLPANANVIKLHEPSKQTLISHLGSCSVFHFAGHGVSDFQDASESRLLLKDWKTDPFTVSDLMGLNLYEKGPWLAYLSACSTGEMQDRRLYDESIHLMSACHAAGFQHVIGSLWEISDWYSRELARNVYENLKDDIGAPTGNVALALHNAIRRLRDQTASFDTKRAAGHADGMYSVDDDDEEEEGGDGIYTSDDGTTRDRGGKVVHVRSSPSRHFGDPLIWAAYIHVGI